MSTLHRRVLMAVAVLLGVTATLIQAAMFNPKGAVVQLNSSNFKKEVLDIEKPTLVAFTAPWCGHCKRLAPEYERAAESLSGVVKFANIDCDEERNKPTCGKYGIQGFPTIKMFPPTKKRIPKDYRGERTAKALADYSAGELPLAGVKKLEASNIQDFAEKDPSRVKVLLFTNKPASSALYKSLALDFRRSMSFASARGDQAPVRSAARIHLGLDIAHGSDLPKLIMLPARTSEAADASDEPPFVKGSYALYDGNLRYHDLKTWLEAQGKEMGAKERNDAPMAKKKPKKEATWKKPKEHHPPGAEPPPGGAFEWKAQNIDLNPKPKKAKKDEKDKPSMLTQERAEELLKQVKEQQGKIKDRASESDQTTSDKVAEAGLAASAAAQDAGEKASSVMGKLADATSEAASKVAEKTANAAQAYADGFNSATDAIDPENAKYTATTKATSGSSKDSQEEASFRDTAEAVMSALKSKLGANLRDTADSAEMLAYNMHGDTDELEERDPGALLGAFAKYISGQPTIWSSDMTEEVVRARDDAMKLAKEDPIKAMKVALKQEKWLLANLDIDRKHMATELGEDGLAKLDALKEILKKRVALREGTDVDSEKQDKPSAASSSPLHRHEDL